jgi:hypothetical protein
MIAYRYKTPNRQGTKKDRKDDPVVAPSAFTIGRVVFVPDADGVRQEYLCIGVGTDPLPREKYFEWKKEQAAVRAKTYRARPRRRKSGGNHSDLVHTGIGGIYY